jgi:hypothetical protein
MPPYSDCQQIRPQTLTETPLQNTNTQTILVLAVNGVTQAE